MTSPYSHMPVTTRNQESGLIRKENGLPMLVFLRKPQTSSAMCCSEFWILGGSSAPQTRPTITTCHVPKITILVRCCPGLLLYSPVSWSRTDNRATTLRPTSSLSATVLWVAPSSSICTAVATSGSSK